MDVLLVYPKTGMDFASTVAPPHALLAVAAPLHKVGYKVLIIDQRTDRQWKATLKKALESQPICVGISTMTGTQIAHALEVAAAVRQSTDGRIPIVWGGVHPSTLPEQTLNSPLVDIVCVGEGEQTFPELVAALDSKRPLSKVPGIAFKDGGKAVMTPARPLLNVNRLLPVPWELVNVEDYIHPDMYLKRSPRTLDVGQTSRGCCYNCAFCSSASIRQHRWRPMSVERSLEAIVEPVKRFNLTGIWIRDDEFYIERARANRICEGMEQLNIDWYTSGTRVDVFNRAKDEEIALLRRSGAYVVKFGAESGSERVLKLMNKGITPQDTLKANLRAKQHGIIPVFAFMVGYPAETFAEINATLDLAMRLKRDNPQAMFESLSPLLALPGTPVFSTALEMGLRPPDRLEGWANWVMDEYDPQGARLPWFSAAQRKRIGNLCYIWLLANAWPNALDGLKSRTLKALLKAVYTPFQRYFQFRLEHKMYGVAPELALVSWLRSKVFYER